MERDDVHRVRRAIAGYFRAAAALGSASVLMREAAMLHDDEDPEDEDSERAFYLERSEMYEQKADLTSRSALALLVGLGRAPQELDDAGDDDLFGVLARFSAEIDEAADCHVDIVDALADASFAGRSTYPALLEQLRGSVRFLRMESAAFVQAIEEEAEEPGG